MPNTISGTEQDDVFNFNFFGADWIITTDEAEVVFAGAGNDRISTWGGDDTILAGDGDDIAFAGLGNDLVFGEAGNDQLFGYAGDDQLFGGTGDDQLFGSVGDDQLFGGAGNDRLSGSNGNDLLVGGDGEDYLHGGKGNDELHGGAANDTVLGIKGHNTLFGDAGDDYISTGDHTSTVDGGADDDWINVRMKKGGDHRLTGGTGADTFEFIQSAASKVSNIFITDFELGTDTFLIEGVRDFDYLSHSVIDIDFGITVLVMDTGDSITFANVAYQDFVDYYLDGDDSIVDVNTF